MAERNKRSKRIEMHDEEKLEKINEETKMLMQKYKVDMSLRDLSPKTQYGYEKDLNQWFIYILENQFNQSVKDLTDDDITEFLYWCKQQGNNVERMKRRMSSISAFYKYLRKKKLIQENPTEFLDRPKKGMPIVVQTFLTKEQVQELREKLEEHGNLQLQTYVMFSLSTMARVNAVASIKWKQIDFDNRTVTDVLEKEGKIVDLYFSEEVKDLLLKLKKQREDNGIDDYGWVFFSGHNTEDTPITNGALLEWAKKAGRLIGIAELHPHDFRHSGSSLLKNAGMPLEDVAALLHHENTDTTSRFYIKQDTTRITKLKDQFEI